jgi:hypothetical protein
MVNFKGFGGVGDLFVSTRVARRLDFRDLGDFRGGVGLYIPVHQNF